MKTESAAGTELVLDVFRLNGLLLEAGDRLTAAEGLTAARWQVLGALVLGGEPLPVPRIARRMGLTRQSVQVSVNRLVDDGMLAAEPNAEHARSPLFGLTDDGRAAYERLSAAQQDWIAELTTDLGAVELQGASRVLRSLSAQLGRDPSTRHQEHEPTERATA